MFFRSTPFLTNEAAMKSILLGMPHCTMSSSSLAVMVGRSTTTPGKFTFFLSPNMAVFSHTHFTRLGGDGGWGVGVGVGVGVRDVRSDVLLYSTQVRHTCHELFHAISLQKRIHASEDKHVWKKMQT